jgi:hypothetical protein
MNQQWMMMIITSGCYATTPWMNRLETPRDTYSLSIMVLPLILLVLCILVWAHISDVILQVALCPAVVVLIIWPYSMRFLDLGYGEGQGVRVKTSRRQCIESKDLCLYPNNTSIRVCSCFIIHKLRGSQRTLMRKTVRQELASFQQTLHATDLYHIRSS